MTETLKHKAAFETYYSMGDNRTLQKLANALHVSRNTCNTWHKEFGWAERLQLRDQNNAKKLEEKTDTKLVDDKAKMLNVVRKATNQFIQNLNNNKVEIATIQDFERLAKLSLLLQGDTVGQEQQKIVVEIVK